MGEQEVQPDAENDLEVVKGLNAYEPELPSHPCPCCQLPLETVGEDLICPDLQNCGFMEFGENP